MTNAHWYLLAPISLSWLLRLGYSFSPKVHAKIVCSVAWWCGGCGTVTGQGQVQGNESWRHCLWKELMLIWSESVLARDTVAKQSCFFYTCHLLFYFSPCPHLVNRSLTRIEPANLGLSASNTKQNKPSFLYKYPVSDVLL